MKGEIPFIIVFLELRNYHSFMERKNAKKEGKKKIVCFQSPNLEEYFF